MTKLTSTPTPQQTQRSDRITALYIGLTYNQLEENKWLPMMRISWDDDGNYYHSYTQAFSNNYYGLEGHVLNPERGYTKLLKEKKIIEILNNRTPRRPDSMVEYDLLGIEDLKGDAIAYLARSGGEVQSDRYDVFPEIAPNSNEVYDFYFPISGICELYSNRDLTAKIMFDLLPEGRKLELRHTVNNTEIYHLGTKIGYCPKYVSYLLKTLDNNYKYQLSVERVNKLDPRYVFRAIANLKIKSHQNLFNNPLFETIHPMPV